MEPLEWLGRGAGVLTAPITGGIAWLRRARTFHPSGVTHRAEIRVHPTCLEDLRATAERLRGSGLIRMSSAWWKNPPGREWRDLLGVGIRIGDGTMPPQDLLFATARSLVTLLPAALTTNVHDFLANDYFAMAPFAIDGVGRVRMKLKSRGRSPDGPHREQRLQHAVASGDAGFDLLILRAGSRSQYEPFLRIVIGDRVQLDDNKLQLSPEHAGRGIRPVGFVNAARRLAYASSRRARR